MTCAPFMLEDAAKALEDTGFEVDSFFDGAGVAVVVCLGSSCSLGTGSFGASVVYITKHPQLEPSVM